jgi:phosphopentomutase
MSRALIIMLDSFGIGATADAAQYGDAGADTLRHIAEYCAHHQRPLQIPNLLRLGINHVAAVSQGSFIQGLENNSPIGGLYGCAKEVSLGKDTQSGHWEMAGLPVLFEWGYFSPDYPSFPPELLTKLIKRAQLPGVIGNKHASGTEIITELGELHQQTGQPIVYTSADSVFQIAAHEQSFGLDRLYEVCEIARELVDDHRIGRVIARPFSGEPTKYYRTHNRRDYATPPHADTLLNQVVKAGHEVIAIGKIADIYANSGITKAVKAKGDNKVLFDAFLQEAMHAPPFSITFVNLVDFDMVYGHRRDVLGYAKALEDFDSWLPAFEKILQPGDLAIITADHGCDPTWPGSDHTREHVPILAFGPNIQPGPIGIRETFADIGQSIAKHLGLPALAYGKAFV